jgi:hypothetical protein
MLRRYSACLDINFPCEGTEMLLTGVGHIAAPFTRVDGKLCDEVLYLPGFVEVIKEWTPAR